MDNSLADIAQSMVADGQGILAADESTATIQRRFDPIGVENTEENRRAYRELLFTSTEAMRDYVSGVILIEETLGQSTKEGRSFVSLFEDAGALPGIKVDKGTTPLAGFPGESITEGLDGLGERLTGFYERGARFAKWRAVIDIAATLPTRGAIAANAHALARYAALCQENGIVPIVEPEVVMDGPGSSHDITRCYAVTALTLNIVFAELFAQHVDLAGIILKPNMVVAGQNGPQASPDEVAQMTLDVLKATVPPAVPGIAFLSGGQSDAAATEHLAIMNKMGGFPWKLTFSYGRALQQSCLKAWRGKPENVVAAQAAFAHRARMNARAAVGNWSVEDERAGRLSEAIAAVVRQRLILLVPADLAPTRLAEALDGGDVAAVVIPADGVNSRALVEAAQLEGCAALVAYDLGVAGAPPWPIAFGADGVHAGGDFDGRLGTVTGRPEGASVGAVAETRHEAMMLGEAGADYLWFGSPRFVNEGALELACWWQALFEVPGVAAGPPEDEAIGQLIATGVEFIAVDVFSGPAEPRNMVASINGRLDAERL